MLQRDEDFSAIVVGGGSAGCLLAARLSDLSMGKVLLLEAGPSDWNPVFHVPLASGEAIRRGWYGWGFESEPCEGLDWRRLTLPRAKVLGGGSAVNAMIYVRGHRDDYDGWASAGNRGWGYSNVLPLFKRSEVHEVLGEPYHGTAGALYVSRAKSTNPIYEAFISSGEEAGFCRNSDFNGASQEGFGRYDFNILNGRRCSSSVAFLRSAKDSGNLKVITHAYVTKILIRGTRAIGVEYVRHGHRSIALAGQVVLCAGSIGSPHLLMNSGIGDPEQLDRAGVRVVHPLPGVGKNLQDHAQVLLQYSCLMRTTLHSLARVDRMTMAFLRALILRSGPATRFPTEAGAFTKSDPVLSRPDLQWHFMNGLTMNRLRCPLPFFKSNDPKDQEGFTVSVCHLSPESRGEVRLKRSNPVSQPEIHLNWFSTANELNVLLQGIKQVRRVVNQKSLRPFVGMEISPGVAFNDDTALCSWITRNATTVHHQIGTCKMGRDDLAVVDDELRVRGVDALRVADASIMPTIVAGNTNAPTLMIAEKAAELISKTQTCEKNTIKF